MAPIDDSCIAFEHEQPQRSPSSFCDDNQGGHDMVFDDQIETVNELTDSTSLYLEMVKDLSTAGRGAENVYESKDKWYEEVVTDVQEHFSEELSKMEKYFLTHALESDFDSLRSPRF